MHDNSYFGRFNHWLARLATWPIRSVFNRPDIVHIHFSHGLSTFRKLILLRLWKLSGCRVILHAHSSDYAEKFPRRPRPMRWLISRFVCKADLLIVLSESWQEFYSSALGYDSNRIRIMKTPVEIPEGVPSIDSDKPIVLFSGRVGERKGTFSLIEAWNALPKHLTMSAELVITGDGDVDRARRFARTSGHGSNISVLGWVSDETLSRYLMDCVIYVLPSKNEGMPMGLIEAMAHSKAVISTPVGGIPELISHRHNGLLVNPGSVEELRGALEELLVDEELRASISAEARRSVEPLDFVTYMNNMRSIWSEA